jgi:hypothetical protein
MMGQHLVGQGLPIIETSRSHSDTLHSVGLLCMSDQPDAETSISKHTTLTRDRHPYPWGDSNLQSQEASDRRPTRGHWDLIITYLNILILIFFRGILKL